MFPSWQLSKATSNVVIWVKKNIRHKESLRVIWKPSHCLKNLLINISNLPNQCMTYQFKLLQFFRILAKLTSIMTNSFLILVCLEKPTKVSTWQNNWILMKSVFKMTWTYLIRNKFQYRITQHKKIYLFNINLMLEM